MKTFRVYRTSTFLTGHRPENERSYLELKDRVDKRASIANWYIDFLTDNDFFSFVSDFDRVILKKPTYEGTYGDLEIYDHNREDFFIDQTVN